jgi:hypothetical protein
VSGAWHLLKLAAFCYTPFMADIMIRCPTFGMAVPTGFTTEMIILDTLDFPLTVHCPACREIHRWTRRDAWIEKDRQVN